MKQVLQSHCLNIIWCFAMIVYIVAGVNAVPIHGDESTQIYMGRDFYYHLQGNSEKVFFHEWDTLEGDEATEQQLRLLNGTLPKYIFGMIAYLSDYTIDEINQQWSWGSGWQWNHDNGHVPPDDLLYRTRLGSAILLAISAVGLFTVGYQIAGRAVAYLASAYYVFNPAVLLNGRRAMMEGGMLAFTIVAILIALYLLKYRTWWTYVLLGVVSGLAVASKHTSVVTIMVIYLVCGAYFLLKLRKERHHILGLFGAGILSLVVFFGLNPAWWHNPVGTVSTVLDLRQDLLQGQVGFFGGYDTFTEQTLGFTRQSFVVIPMYAESDFDGFYSEQLDLIQQYDQSLLSGVSLGGSTIGGIIIFLLSLIGIWGLWQSEQIEQSAACLISAWFIAMILLTLILTPLEWQRYYLPIYPVIGILAAIGLDFSIKTVKQWQNNNQTQ